MKMRKGRKPHRNALALSVSAIFVLMAFTLASCGASTSTKESDSDTTKLPPGVTGAEASGSVDAEATSPAASPSGDQVTQESDSSATSSEESTPSNGADLYGARFTVIDATRPTSNKSVSSSSDREVAGDYLEVELTVQNVATDHLVDLSEYSFRLSSPGINASSYYNYYGDSGTFGKYVSANVISASLLDYSTLQPVAYKVKVGETVTKVFLFFDLNPENVGRNPSVTKDNTSLVIYKASGTDYGETATIPLAGYPD
jgi:hypothetical protein